MKRDVIAKPLESSFLSCEKDAEIILRKLFIESQQHSETLKRLLVVQSKDALDVKVDMKPYSLKRLKEEEYVNLDPVLQFPEHDQVKAVLSLHFDNFTPNFKNPQFRDSMIHIDILCHHSYWDLGDYRQRPFKIAGYVDGILNNAKLTGIGELLFAGANQVQVSENWSVLALTYAAVHGSDDRLPDEE